MAEEVQFNQKLGALIRKKRKSLGMTQTDLAKRLGVTFQQIQKYEAGESIISPYKLHKVSMMLDVSFAAYLRDDFPPLKTVRPVSRRRMYPV